MYKQGTVEKIDFTCGGAGNQWTTISGTRYATWWDARTIDWKVGDSVTFDEYSAPFWDEQPPVLSARNIHRAHPTKSE